MHGFGVRDSNKDILVVKPNPYLMKGFIMNEQNCYPGIRVGDRLFPVSSRQYNFISIGCYSQAGRLARYDDHGRSVASYCL